MNLEELLIKTRKDWVKAREAGDTTKCLLLEKIGSGIKARIMERVGLQAKDEEIENIFGGKLL